ncbi:GNAT family N-acetyltransferase [Kibdelosporangium persicum]|uniref:GNAT family N-acetyltransferase n=1 Tax=Kibdelosporangium persicum TaxID=2698649 RepID=A0ABX2FCU7_9PSEU|nr:GNAT family N-acetyltransferase [Kibdelosporangium persicum]NRN69189.1 GNAT family N-acetyltransferase [Kibdelosporangium persicum]
MNSLPTAPDDIEYVHLGPDEALAHLDALSDVYLSVYSETPYNWGDEQVELFRQRFAGQVKDPGFDLVAARVTESDQIVGFIFGVTLRPTTPWWHNLITEVPPDLVDERPGRTFAVVELVVLSSWRRRGIARHLHDLLLAGRTEERATLTVLPAAAPAQHAYRVWGWHKVAQKRNPLPGSPIFDVMIKQLD